MKKAKKKEWYVPFVLGLDVYVFISQEAIFLTLATLFEMMDCQVGLFTLTTILLFVQSSFLKTFFNHSHNCPYEIFISAHNPAAVWAFCCSSYSTHVNPIKPG